MSAAPGSARQRGLSLIEVQVAFVLLGLILALVFASLQLATRGWAAVEARLDRHEDLRLAASFITRQLTQAHPVSWLDDGGAALAFSGHPGRVVFAGRMPAHLQWGELRLMSIVLETGDGRGQLVFRHRPLHPGAGPADGWSGPDSDRAVLLDGVASAHLDYFGFDPQTRSWAWSNRWNHPEQMPALVRLRVVLDDQDNPFPELLVALPANRQVRLPQMFMRADGSRGAAVPNLEHDEDQGYGL